MIIPVNEPTTDPLTEDDYDILDVIENLHGSAARTEAETFMMAVYSEDTYQ